LSTEITVSIIASFTSLIIALISWFGSRRSTKLIESFKFGIKILGKKIDSLDEMIESIQKMKDDLQVILNSPDETYDADSAKQHIVLDREHIFKCYEKNLPNLDKKDASHSHKAKNKALIIVNLILKSLKTKEYVSELNLEERNELIELRNNLTDIQNLLRDSKTSIAFDKSSNFL
jgi:hypothetical protein